MKIVQVTPGVMPIPTKGWGAIEKIIWEYKKQLDFLGYETSIAYADEVENVPGQIVHVHMANLANILHERGIEYTFSLHDHHVEYLGKDSSCYADNYRAIRNAKVAFVHSPHLAGYFDNLPNIVYLQHGANLNDYKFTDRSESIRQGIRLVMMANNGIGGDPLKDRKGFLLGISAAEKIGAPITIICPGSNRQFFDHHSPEYTKLEVVYDLDHDEAIEELSRHNIFLNPSSIEAGHPNLTVTESIALGLPVVGTSYVDMPGLVRCETDKLVEYIIECAMRYDGLIGSIERNRYRVSWEIVVNKLVQTYKKTYSVTERQQLDWNYSSTKKICLPKQEKKGVVVEFTGGKAFLKTSIFSEGLSAVFRNNKTNEILYETSIARQPGQWAYMFAPPENFIDWEVSLNYGTVALHTERLNLRGKRVLITGPVSEKQVVRFAEMTGAFVTLRDVRTNVTCYEPNPDDESFYTTYNDRQIADFFSMRPRKVDRKLLRLESTALGDSIGFVPYAQEWAALQGEVVDVSMSWPDIFDKNKYPNLNLIKATEVNSLDYNHIYRFEYQFDKPLQRGYSDQFGLEYKEIPAVIKKSGKRSPHKNKYAVLGVQTTAQCKYWNYPGGWEKLSKMLKKEGIEPVAVDRYETFGIDGYWNTLPESSIRKVGMDFSDVIRWIEHCEVFIGVCSGLSWLAYGLGKKVVMIVGTSEEGTEFEINNTFVSNRNVCNGCFSKPEMHRFNSGDWLWCPKHKGTKRQFECTKTITPEMVMAAVKENL